MAAPSLASKTLVIAELFASLQGESTHAGRPCVFVRLSGCPLRCTWCDTRWAFAGGERLSLEEILSQVADFGLPLVEVTGGEPLAQTGARALIAALCDAGHEVLVETSGAVEMSGVDPRAVLIADLKCPSSGESARIRWAELGALRAQDELKIVVASREDFDWARAALSDRLSDLKARVLWSPVWGALEPSTLAGWLLKGTVPGRMQLQLHKVLWPGEDRGR